MAQKFAQSHWPLPSAPPRLGNETSSGNPLVVHSIVRPSEACLSLAGGPTVTVEPVELETLTGLSAVLAKTPPESTTGSPPVIPIGLATSVRVGEFWVAVPTVRSEG